MQINKLKHNPDDKRHPISVIYGQTGIGRTHFCLSLSQYKFKSLLIDTEGRVNKAMVKGFQAEYITVRTMEDLSLFYTNAFSLTMPYDLIIIDSMSALQHLFQRHYLTDESLSFVNSDGWILVRSALAQFHDQMKLLGKPIIYIAQMKIDEINQLQPDLDRTILYDVDFIAMMTYDRSAKVRKLFVTKDTYGGRPIGTMIDLYPPSYLKVNATKTEPESPVSIDQQQTEIFSPDNANSSNDLSELRVNVLKLNSELGYTKDKLNTSISNLLRKPGSSVDSLSYDELSEVYDRLQALKGGRNGNHKAASASK